MDDDIKPYSILFIEDETGTRKNYVKFLKRYFENVYEASDGEEAYHIYKDKKPDILIIDINIPKLNGIELLSKIREKDHTTKAIMLTAHSETSYLLDAAELKLTKYLVKPISRAQLKESLNIVLEELSRFKTVSSKLVILKDGYIWNKDKKELLKDNIEEKLTSNEIKALDLFFNNIGISLPYDDIIVHIWDDFEKDKVDSVKTLIKHLRRKLPKDTIKNVYGIGYKVDV
ncbi:MAG: response regulator transcription factor [Campylobacterota bacterium]|nr:response regulator transcription factor [Campylobacterota bacterium]